MNHSNSCHLCGETNTTSFFDLPPVPTMDGVMSMTREEAIQVPVGKVKLQFCPDCGFIQNNGYDQNKISFDTYDFANDYSPLFREFIQDLARKLIEDHDIRSSQILEIACGDGHFLRTLCELGDNTGIGFDPGFKHDEKHRENHKVTYRKEYYSEKHHNFKPDLLVCRHLINLLDSSRPFLEMIRKNLENSPDTLVYIEVPNAEYTFKEKVYWNVGYEHGAWFTSDSLKQMMERCRFQVREVFTCWNDEFLGVLAKPDTSKNFKPVVSNRNGISATVSAFSKGFDRLLERQRSQLAAMTKQGKKMVAWGAGARAVTYFNVLETNGSFKYIVDINVNRHNKYLPGAGIKIIPPEYLKEYKPDYVLITNPTYKKEITSHLHQMGLNPEIMSL